MKKTHPKSTFEVWRSDYINDINVRQEQDRRKIILQIGSSYDNGDNYMVEIINEEDIIID